MKEIDKELFYKIISDHKLDVVVSAHIVQPGIIESRFEFRDRTPFGYSRQVLRYTNKAQYFITEHFYKKYIHNEDFTPPTQEKVVRND